MPRAINKQHLENRRLARKYRPLLVLYPEIEDGSRRKDHHRRGHGSSTPPPLDQDYHPRDICLVLDQARLPGMKEKPSREQLLDAMDKNKIKHIDLIDERGPKYVDKFWRVYADIKDKDSNPDYHRKAYAWVVKGSGRFKDYISIQYWLPYFFDDWANVHEMDWEMVSIILKIIDSKEEPIACVYNAHLVTFRKPWKDVHKVDDKGNKNPEGLHPVAYIANGSHASYFFDYPPYFNVAEKYVRNELKMAVRMILVRLFKIAKTFTDYVPKFESGVRCLPDLEVVPQPDKNGSWAGDWRWLNFKGKWGSPVELSFKDRLIRHIKWLLIILNRFKLPLREDGITGPSAKGVCWEDPFNWINLECLDAEESRDWLARTSGTSANEL